MRTLQFDPSHAPPDDANAPETLGPYVLHEVTGRGGGGIVYRAQGPAGPVAVKTLGRSTEVGTASLRAEIHALRRIQHPGVVQVLDDGVDNGVPWFAMEWLEGETLGVQVATRADERSRRGAPVWTPIELRALLDRVAAICEPLAALHEAGIVHRDLKPTNVFLRNRTAPVLVDFGLATHHAPGDARATFDLRPIAGTLGYMAPEQYSGELVDARTDLYALGCILFELLVGAPVASFEAGTAASRLAGGIPEPLDALVASLLAPRARDRIGHVQDVLVVLDQVRGRPSQRASVAQPWLYRPFLSGRADVLERLKVGSTRLASARGSFMVLEGESGIGKTHVASALARQLAPETTLVSATCVREGGVPLACFGRLFELVVDRTLERPERALARTVAKHLPLLSRLHGAFARLAPTPSVSLPTPDEVFAAVRDLFAALAADRPVLLLFDDLQWIDELSLGVLQLLSGDFLATHAVFILATCRNDERARALDGLVAERIPLGPLPDSDLRELVADMLGVGEPPDGITAWIAGRAEGNPFLAAEYLRLVVSELPMQRELALPLVRIVPPTAAALDRLPTPVSVRDLVARRLETLGASALGMAKLVAVLGGTLHADVLEALESHDADRDALLELEQRQLVEPTLDGGRRLLHDRIRVVLYDALLDGERALLHERAAGLLCATSDVPHAAVARHLALSGDLAESLPHLEMAGALALSKAAHEAAVRHFDEVRVTAARLVAEGAEFTLRRRAGWEIDTARAHYGHGNMAATERHVRAALGLAGRTLPSTRLQWTALALREALTSGAASLGLARDERGEAGLHGDVARAASLLPYRYFYEEDVLPVIASALLSANLARHGTSGASVAAGPMSLLGFLAGLFRLPGVSQRCFEAAARDAWAQHDYREAAQVLSLECMEHGNHGRWSEAERAAASAADACARTSDPWLLETVETSRAHVEFFTGRFESARERAQRVTRIASERQHDQHAVWGLYLQARSDLPLQRFDSAAPLLEEALRRLADRPEVISEVACHGMLAHARLAEGDLRRAETHARWVVTSVAKRAPPAYPSIVGYSGAAHVLRALVESDPTAERKQAARSIGVALWRFASMFPVALPAACLHAGHRLRLAGHTRTAHAAFLRGVRWAAQRTMPWEESQLVLGAAATAPSRETQRTLQARAGTMLETLGVPRPT